MNVPNYKKVVIALMASVALTGIASAQIIYEDQFGYTGAITGVAPDTHDTGGNVWTVLNWSGGDYIANSGYASGGGAGNDYGGEYLPINSSGVTLDGTQSFTLSVNVATGSFGGGGVYNYSGLVLTSTTTPENSNSNVYDSPQTGFFATLGLQGGGPVVANSASSTIGTLASGSNNGLLQIVYTAGASPSLAFYDNSTLVATESVTASQIAGLTDVGIVSAYSGQAQLSTFELSITSTPEPSAYVLMLGGLVGLVAWMRLRRA